MDTEELIQTVKNMGALNAAVIPAGALAFDPGFRALCQDNVCGQYGRCWMCPPDCGAAEDLINEAKSYQNVLVYQTVGQLEDSFDVEGMAQAAEDYYALARKLNGYFKTLPYRNMLHLGAGGCHVCPTCAKVTGEPCRFPEEAIHSMSAYCIHVSKLAASAGMKYISGKDTVTYFGALLLKEEL